MAAEFSAIVLAGGRSSRMGRPKDELDFGGMPLLDRVIAELQPSFPDMVVVAAPEGLGLRRDDVSGVTIVRYEREYQGPLPALARGLGAIRCDAAFACSCDLPLLDARVANALCAMLGDYDAVVPEIGGLVQPLHAVYRKRCAAPIDAMIARGEKRLVTIVESIKARRAGEDELRRIDPGLRSFLNVNTPEDYQRALRLISESSKSA